MAMDKAYVLDRIKKGLSSHFEMYSWENMIDDLELTEEETTWAKENISYIAYIIGGEEKIKAIDSILDYILYSEMEGKLDKTDPWYPIYESLEELKGKIKDEEE